MTTNRLLLVLDYLWCFTDETHVVTIKELETYLAGKGVHANRKTLTQDLKTLEDFGLDVVCNRSTQNRFFLATRVFDYTEVRLLIDAVQSSRFITPRKSKALVKKLSSFVSESQKQDVDQQLYVDGAVKSAALELTPEDIRYLEELYVPHALVGVMAQNRR